MVPQHFFLHCFSLSIPELQSFYFTTFIAVALKERNQETTASLRFPDSAEAICAVKEPKIPCPFPGAALQTIPCSSPSFGYPQPQYLKKRKPKKKKENNYLDKKFCSAETQIINLSENTNQNRDVEGNSLCQGVLPQTGEDWRLWGLD